VDACGAPEASLRGGMIAMLEQSIVCQCAPFFKATHLYSADKQRDISRQVAFTRLEFASVPGDCSHQRCLQQGHAPHLMNPRLRQVHVSAEQPVSALFLERVYGLCVPSCHPELMPLIKDASRTVATVDTRIPSFVAPSSR
jgi:hypothetical protein